MPLSLSPREPRKALLQSFQRAFTQCSTRECSTVPTSAPAQPMERRGTLYVHQLYSYSHCRNTWEERREEGDEWMDAVWRAFASLSLSLSLQPHHKIKSTHGFWCAYVSGNRLNLAGGRESIRMEDDLGIISERRGGRRGSGSKSSIWDGIFLSILLILDGFLNVLWTFFVYSDGYAPRGMQLRTELSLESLTARGKGDDGHKKNQKPSSSEDKSSYR